MKMVRSLLLGSAAGLVAVAGAQAADLPVKAKPVEYVKVCSVYGAGFYYIPGTDTCLKVGGFVRTEIGIHANAGSNGQYINGTGGANDRMTAEYTTRSRAVVTLDARTQTEYGTLRSYMNAGWELNSGDANYRGSLFTFRAFIQFAGLTIGKTESFFSFYNNRLNYTTLVGGGYEDAGNNLVAYTMQFGGGFSASLSLEDPAHHRGAIYDAATATLVVGGRPTSNNGSTFGDYGGTQWPDVVANLRIDQPWGSAQISAAIHDVYGAYQGVNLTTSAPAGSATGWAVQGGVKFNLPWNKGDTFWLQGTWARGASQYLGLNPYVHFAGQIAMFSGNTVALGWGMDGVFNGASGMQLTEGWSILAAAEHYWTPALRTSVFGHYTNLNFPTGARVAFCTGAGFGAGTLPAGCDPSFNIMQLGVRTVWSPVRNLDIGVEVLYTRVDQKMVGTWNLPAGGYNGRAGNYVAADQDTVGGILRIQRNFWP